MTFIDVSLKNMNNLINSFDIPENQKLYLVNQYGQIIINNTAINYINETSVTNITNVTFD